MADILRVASRTMGDVYEFIVKNSSFFIKHFPMQVVIVDRMPDVKGMDLTLGKAVDIQQEQIVCLVEKGHKTGLCLIQNNNNVISILQDLFAGKIHKIKGYMVGSINQVIEGINIDTQVSAENLIEVYKHAIIVSKILNIKTPLIIVSLPDMKRRAFRLTFKDKNDHPVGDIIYVTIQLRPRMIHSVIHELRHCWQEYNAQGYFNNYKDAWDGGELSDQYLNQKEEIDADAFASMYLNSQGYDGIRMAFQDDEEYNDPFWIWYKIRINNRIKEIEMIQDNIDKA